MSTITRFPKSEKDTCSRARAGDPGPFAPAGAANPSAEVASLCDDVDGKQTAQLVFYGLGGVFIAGGAILILTDKHSSASSDKPVETTAFSLKLQPTLTPHYQAFSLVGTF